MGLAGYLPVRNIRGVWGLFEDRNIMRDLLHLFAHHPRYVNPRFQRLGFINHLGEWHWHWRRIFPLVFLVLGEAGGLYISYREGSWSGVVVASALVLYILMSIMLKEMPLFTETDIRKRRNAISRIWGDIKWPCYCQLRLREHIIWFADEGLDLDDDVDRVARHIVGTHYIAVPPGVIGYLGHKEYFDDEVDMIASEKCDDYRDALKQAVEDHYFHLAYVLDDTPARHRRLPGQRDA